MLKKSKRTLVVMMALAMLLIGCAAKPAHTGAQDPVNSPAVSVPVSSGDAPVQSKPASSDDAPIQSGPVSGDDAPVQSAPVSDGDKPVATEPVSEAPANTGSLNYHRPTDEERRQGKMEMFLKYCSTQATAETSVNACVVDVRTAENPYDVVWDYGDEYDTYLVSDSKWELVFDADYYMAQFPMLAYQYHYDEDLLLKHFQTVGVHEGRQGCAEFNVADYMSKCPADVRELFGDCYAAYYFYWMAIETDHDMDVSGNGQPKQLVAVLTAMQAKELKQVNALRESLGEEPLIFDSELAAMGNFRGWVDAAEDWPLHDWLKSHRDEAYQMMVSFGSTYASENTVKSYSPHPCNWYDNYYRSKDHYDAMVDTKNAYIGCSNAYLGNCEHKPAGIVMVEFDMFSYDISTALNPGQ